MKQNRTVTGIAYIGEDWDERFQIMPIDRAYVEKAHFLEDRAARQKRARMGDGARDRAIDLFRQMTRQTTSCLAHRHIAAARH